MTITSAAPAPAGDPGQERRRLTREPQPPSPFHVIVTDHAHHPIDASPETAAVALGRLDPLGPLNHAVIALGLRDAMSSERTGPPTDGSPRGAFSVAWRLPTGRRARAHWNVGVDPVGASGSLLSVAVHVGTDDPADAPQFLDAWPLVSPVVDAQTQRLLRSITELAEDLAEEYSPRNQASC